MYDYLQIVDSIEEAASNRALAQIREFEVAVTDNVTAILDYCNAYSIGVGRKCPKTSWTRHFLAISADSDKFDIALDTSIANEFARIEELEEAIDRLRRLVKD